MMKVSPSKVPPIIKSGKKTYKPEMAEAIKMQHSVLKYSHILSKEKYKNLTLQEKFIVAEKIECKILYNECRKDLSEWDSNEVL